MTLGNLSTPAPRDDDLAALSNLIGIIPAAGVGSRMQSTTAKQFLTIGDQTLLAHAVGALLANNDIKQVVVVISKDDSISQPLLAQTFAKQIGQRLMVVACGGATRAESVTNGLHYVQDSLNYRGVNDWALVHDAARPGLSQDALGRLITQVLKSSIGGLLALPITDTVKSQRGDAPVKTISRDGLWAAQTPQMFRIKELRDALDTAIKSGAVVTDEAQAIEAAGHAVQLIVGERVNAKVTVPEDLMLVTVLMQQKNTKDTK